MSESLANSRGPSSPATASFVSETSARFFDDIVTRAEDGDAGCARLRDTIAGDESRQRLVACIFDGSPFLRELILRRPEMAANILTADPGERLKEICTDLPDSLTACDSDRDVGARLRRARSAAALLIAVADLSGVWTVEQVTAALTRFADAVLGATVEWLLRDALDHGRLRGLDTRKPGLGSGFFVLAMGKYGAGELNYSSDIDIIAFYDPETAPVTEGVEPSVFFVRLTRRLAGLLQDITEEGYVFRVDLRLRPDPRATSAAIAVEAAAVYYENLGQNWERAAMIKARPAAGDIAAGEAFLERLRPFVWRKYLDFAAILDVQSMKRQIHSAKGHGKVAVRGHNLKLGRGGIREIEFFVQTQQLIAGGRNPALRGRRTVEMLDELASAEWISLRAAGELKEAYHFLRTIEHRLQMVADEQTHVLPADEEAFARFARFAGYEAPGAFADAVEATLRTVEGHYAALFEQSPALSAEEGSLVFTGGDDDPNTMDALRALNFKATGEIAATIRGWHFGRYAATRSARARERLTEIMPGLLSALARTGEPDTAFIAFDRFLAGLPAGVQLFSLLWANPGLLDLLATIMGTAPRLARQLSHRPKVFDAVLDPGFFGPLPDRQEILASVDQALEGANTHEEILDRARIVGHEQMFRIGVRIISGTVDAEEAGAAYSTLADIMAERLLKAAEDAFAERHGRIPSGHAAILAMGKWGGREMTASSDLDLILIYDMDEEASGSDGDRPLSPGQYYARLTQRMIAALSAPTAEGVLYEVDMRLRPSGNSGPTATHIASFEAYHRDTAWTWERMALTRARIVSGGERLTARIDAAIREALATERDIETIRADVLDMRRRLRKEFGGSGVWNVKHADGGLIDVEFIAQFLQIAYAARHPEILCQRTHDALGHLSAAGLLGAAETHALRDANAFYHRMTQLLRLCVEKTFDAETAPEGLKRLLARAADAPDFSAAEARLADTQAQVQALFTSIVGEVEGD